MSLSTGLVRHTLTATSRVAPGLAGRYALRLFAVPVTRTRLKPQEQPVMRAARREEHQVNGKTAVVYRWGDGTRPVLLMHGWQFRASRFSPLVAAMAERGYSPVAFDAPGHGEGSGRATTILEYLELARRLQAVDGRYSALVGHSVGALAAFFALQEGIAAERLVSLAAPADFAFAVDSFCAGLRVGPRVKPALRRAVELRLFPGEKDIWNRFSAIHRHRDLTVPMLLVHDRDDATIPLRETERIAEVYREQADLLITGGLGHRRLLAAPEVIEAVGDFLTATEPAGRAG
ncbi:alpha/beta hydrolase [Streptomyces hoynatensis]|uniref:Alpha/beta hydrolase n=1 Tax=Streptomyces hoynatensis TaxID=1141874 RepID=A0A3A9YTL1_9ACTN|nr:alpha/beta hydrolase [Streptomyces hoynatensis]RKN38596.1 alpha/beta hydrolase [Streptomyces hoynatensis]